MRVGLIADIHININLEYDLVELITENILENKIETLIIAGDISNNYNETVNFIDDLIAKSKISVYFVPGNHDMWSEEKDTLKIYKAYEKHPACLINKIVHLTKKTSLIGDIGWYDYSYGNKKFSDDEFNTKQYAQKTWQDSLNTNWEMSDKEVSKMCYDNLENSLEKLNNKDIILATHFLCHEEFLVPEIREPWEFFNAFLGSANYKDLVLKYNVKYAVMGHVHYRKQIIENNTTFICPCLNYAKEWQNDDVKKQINLAMSVIEVE